MKLMTKDIKRIAQKQYDEGSDMEQKVVAKYFDSSGQLEMVSDEYGQRWGLLLGHSRR